MIIAGAKGFAIQLTDILDMMPDKYINRKYYDDINLDVNTFLDLYDILHSIKDVESYFKSIENTFAIGLAKPILRKKYFELFSSIGGKPQTIISPKAIVGKHQIEIGEGSTILSGVVIESKAKIGRGVLINLNATITHECTLGDFTEISPGVHLSGECKVGNGCFIGTGAVLLPKVKIGNNVIIGAGAVVTRDIEDDVTIKGMPAR
jgi:sugar O-acyltransferase (sialic acid O-acetyltransferase NeuD family)